ncbi:MAG TPA: DUF1559 domain-containing protein, partial [Gemmataceae bacterium]
CPSDPNDQPSTKTPPTYPTTYAAAWGDWFVFNWNTAQFGNGALPGVAWPGQRGAKLLDITDGTSTTVGFAEVKAHGPLLAHPTNLPLSTPVPTSPADVVALGGTFTASGAHVSWAEGLAQYTAMTFVFPPNTEVPYVNPADGKTYDADWIAGTTINHNAITSRSYHAGGVNALLMDGSVRFVTNAIPQATWRALGTRNGGEPVGDF